MKVPLIRIVSNFTSLAILLLTLFNFSSLYTNCLAIIWSVQWIFARLVPIEFEIDLSDVLEEDIRKFFRRLTGSYGEEDDHPVAIVECEEDESQCGDDSEYRRVFCELMNKRLASLTSVKSDLLAAKRSCTVIDQEEPSADEALPDQDGPTIDETAQDDYDNFCAELDGCNKETPATPVSGQDEEMDTAYEKFLKQSNGLNPAAEEFVPTQQNE